MPTESSVDIAELLEALDGCCTELSELIDSTESELGEYLGAGADPDGLRWQKLTLGQLPLIDQLASVVRPPLQVIMTILQVIAGILDALAVIVGGLLDPFKMLILAAYEAVKALIQDILSTGLYLFFDAPGITSPGNLGRGIDLVAEFTAGRTSQRPSPPSADGFQLWARHFRDSFDDPGDHHRPMLSDGAEVAALFILVSGPDGGALRQTAYLLGNLLQIDAFKQSLERFNPDAPDPRRSRGRTESVAPDWRSVRMEDLFPPLRELMRIPEALRGLLLAAEGLSQVLSGLANAIREKAAVLESLIAAIDAVIAMLESLKDAGLYMLPVASTEGPEGLTQAFLEAKDRPPGEFVGGVCLLGGVPGVPDPAMLWELLGVTDAFVAAESRMETIHGQAGEALGKGLDKAREQAGDDPLLDALVDAHQALADATGRSLDELLDAAKSRRVELVDWLEEAIEAGNIENVSEAILNAIDATRNAQRRSNRSLALGFGLLPSGPGGGER